MAGRCASIGRAAWLGGWAGGIAGTGGFADGAAGCQPARAAYLSAALSRARPVAARIARPFRRRFAMPAAVNRANWSPSTNSFPANRRSAILLMPVTVWAGRSCRSYEPLRDERVVQRYLAAVESGEAHGWHTLVYGLTLVVYSLPLRQGLLGYAHQNHARFHSRGGTLAATHGGGLPCAV